MGESALHELDRESEAAEESDDVRDVDSLTDHLKRKSLPDNTHTYHACEQTSRDLRSRRRHALQLDQSPRVAQQEQVAHARTSLT